MDSIDSSLEINRSNIVDHKVTLMLHDNKNRLALEKCRELMSSHLGTRFRQMYDSHMQSLLNIFFITPMPA